MTKKSLLLLVLWNVLLSAALGWSLLHKGGGDRGDASATAGTVKVDTLVHPAEMTTDTATLKDAHIAFFMMDSVRSNFEMVSEASKRLANYGQSLDADLKNRGRALAEKIRALEEKDQRYTTAAEQEEDRKQYEQLQYSMQQLQLEQDRKQQDFDEKQVKALQDITNEIKDYLKEYNESHHFDFIFSIQNEGQIWVGNKGLDITSDVVNGLNEKHRARKAAQPAPVPGK